jgi:hypothetical protein
MFRQLRLAKSKSYNDDDHNDLQREKPHLEGKRQSNEKKKKSVTEAIYISPPRAEHQHRSPTRARQEQNNPQQSEVH